MDPITALATITQLLGLFVQERRTKGNLEKQEFLDWLTEHRHEELKDLIANQKELAAGIEGLLRTDHERVFRELGQINSTLATVMSRMQSFSALTDSLAPSERLSKFAITVLCHFEVSGEKNLIMLVDGSGVQFGNSGSITHDDPRFLEDDMNSLEACAFIQLVNQHNSYAVYNLTRRGCEYAREVRAQIHTSKSGS